MRALVAKALLRASRLQSLEPVVPARGDEMLYERSADALLAQGERPAEIPLVTLLRWIAERRDVLFHGSERGDLRALEPIRLTSDTMPFGDKQAVYAASDPVWAIYFATLRRDRGLRSTRNASLGLAQALYPRWYFFSHNDGAEANGRFGDGWLYVLPRSAFHREPPHLGVLDSGQWASPTPVTPIARVSVTAMDFPFVNRISRHRPDERMLVTILRAAFRR